MCRPPRGGRGLKYAGALLQHLHRRRPPRGGRGLKSIDKLLLVDGRASPPSRGAWIEINVKANSVEAVNVAPLAGGVD